MIVARIQKMGDSQVIVLPKELRLDGEKIFIKKLDDGSFQILDKKTLLSSYKNVFAYLYASDSEGELPDASEFFARDKKPLEEIF